MKILPEKNPSRLNRNLAHLLLPAVGIAALTGAVLLCGVASGYAIYASQGCDIEKLDQMRAMAAGIFSDTSAPMVYGYCMARMFTINLPYASDINLYEIYRIIAMGFK